MPVPPRPFLRLVAAACALIALNACAGEERTAGSAPLRAGANEGGAEEARPAWRALAPGLEVARLDAPGAVQAVVTVVRVDPARWRFSLLSAKLRGIDPAPTITEWVERHGVTGAINASMYQQDGRTSVGYMREGRRINNGRWNAHKAVFAAEPARGGPPALILDRTCQDARGLAARYQLVVQSIRMIDCRGRNVWERQERRWSTAAIGSDGRGRMLLVHCRTPLPAHDLVDALLALPLELRRLMYVEGGAEAALHVRVDGRTEVAEVGSYAEGGLLGQAARIYLPLPNAIGFSPR
jgi:hypothetical protein